MARVIYKTANRICIRHNVTDTANCNGRHSLVLFALNCALSIADRFVDKPD